MRMLVGWDDAAEAETLGLVLDVDDNDVNVCTTHDAFVAAAEESGWDIIVLSLRFAGDDEALPLLQQLQTWHPQVPIIGAWHSDEIAKVARCISHGLQSHIMRDADGNFIFLLTSMADATVAAMAAQRARELAERLKQEVDSVRRLQESVIPHNLPRPTGYRLAARYEPAQIRVLGSAPVTMAGGDYYDVFEVDEDSMVLLVGDASGHGVKACMSIMTMHTLIRMIRTMQYQSTSEFVEEVNRRLCASDIVQDKGGFITLLYSTLDLRENQLNWTSAGAPMPLLQDLTTNEVKQLGNDDLCGLPLAISDGWEYERCSVDIPLNSRLLIYTDGLDEAFPADSDEDQQFGLEGIVRTLQDSVRLPLDQALENLFNESQAFTAGSGRSDDTSVVLLERTE